MDQDLAGDDGVNSFQVLLEHVFTEMPDILGAEGTEDPSIIAILRPLHGAVNDLIGIFSSLLGVPFFSNWIARQRCSSNWVRFPEGLVEDMIA